MKFWRSMGYYPDGSVAPIGYLYYQFSDTAPNEFSEDITSIANVNEFWDQSAKDYKVARRCIIDLATSIGYANLTAAEKKIAAVWFAVDPALTLGDGTISFSEFISLGKAFNEMSKKSRIARLNAAETQIYCRLGISRGQEVISNISSPVNLAFLYTEYGRDGVETGSPEGLWDYVRGTAGTSWGGNGLANKAWQPVDGSSMADVVNSVMNIFINGEY